MTACKRPWQISAWRSLVWRNSRQKRRTKRTLPFRTSCLHHCSLPLTWQWRTAPHLGSWPGPFRDMVSPCTRVRSAIRSSCGTAGNRPTCPHIVCAVSISTAAMLSRAARPGSLSLGTRFGTSRPHSWGRFVPTSRWSQGCTLWAWRFSFTPVSVHFLMFGFSTAANAQMTLAALQPWSSATTSSTNDVNTTSEFKTWRWPPSRLLSSLRPAALTHQPGSYSAVMGWLRCRVSFSLLRSAVMCFNGVAPTCSGICQLPHTGHRGRTLFTPQFRREKRETHPLLTGCHHTLAHLRHDRVMCVVSDPCVAYLPVLSCCAALAYVHKARL